MSRENDFAAIMQADSTLMVTLTGGVYQAGLVGIEGVTRETTPAAFANGYLLPVALVKQRGRIPDGQILDTLDQDTSVTQVVECWIYCDSGDGYAPIDNAIQELFHLFQGHKLNDSFPIEWINTIERQRDEGAFKGKPLGRIDFLVRSIIG